MIVTNSTRITTHELLELAQKCVAILRPKKNSSLQMPLLV